MRLENPPVSHTVISSAYTQPIDHLAGGGWTG